MSRPQAELHQLIDSSTNEIINNSLFKINESIWVFKRISEEIKSGFSVLSSLKVNISGFFSYFQDQNKVFKFQPTK